MVALVLRMHSIADSGAPAAGAECGGRWHLYCACTALLRVMLLLQERSVVDRHGVQVRVIGNLSLLPARVQQAAQRVMRATQHNPRGVLNICLAYT